MILKRLLGSIKKYHITIKKSTIVKFFENYNIYRIEVYTSVVWSNAQPIYLKLKPEYFGSSALVINLIGKKLVLLKILNANTMNLDHLSCSAIFSL